VNDDLLARVTALEAERDILHNMYRYAHTIDVGDSEGWADCFTADGAFQTRGAREEIYAPYRIEGRAALVDFVDHHTRPPGLWHKHMLVEPIVEIDGEEASAQSYFAVLVEQDGHPIVRVMGRYVDRLRREDGRWRFAERNAFIESLTPGLPPLAQGRELAERAFAEAARSQAPSGA
jgi:3-phenylpropionate/cinnamic acid dioxygenase small subunit